MEFLTLFPIQNSGIAVANPARRSAERRKAKCLRSSGFTLIEILVVTVILAIVIAMIVPNLFPDEREHARRESERIFLALERARDEAVFGGRTIGVELQEGRLIFLERDPNDTVRWKISGSETLQPLALPRELKAIRWSVAGSAEPNPRLAFLAAGVSVPFRMTLEFPGATRMITGNPLGNMSVQDGDS